MFSLVMFKNSPKTIKVNKSLNHKKRAGLKRNTKSNYNSGILSGGLFPKPKHKKSKNKTTQIVIKKKKPLLEDLIYYSMKSSNDGSIIFVISNKGVFKTTDKGFQWHITSAPYENLTYNSLYVSSDGKDVLVGACKGKFILENIVILYSNDYGETWNNASIDYIRGDQIMNIVNYKNKLYALTSRGKIYSSNNSGKHWFNSNNLDGQYFNSLCCSNDKMYLVSNNRNKSYIKISKTQGIMWSNFQKINRAYSLIVSKNHQNFVYVNYDKPNYNIFVSKSYGKVWKKTLTLKSRVYLVSDENCKNIVCVAIKNKTLYVSDNYGMTWKKEKPENFMHNLCLINYNNTLRLTL